MHWWRRTWPGHTRPGYPPVALVVTDAGPVALAGRQQAVADLSADCWRGQWCRAVRDYNDDGWREYDDALPIIATTLELLADHGPMGPVWWRFGRRGRPSLTEALENPNDRAAYDLRQAARQAEEHKAHQELMDYLVCIDCGEIPEEESTWVYGSWEAEEQLEAARTANAALRPCWTCRGSIGEKEGSKLELRQEARPDRLECPDCEQARAVQDLGPLMLPVPSRRELVAALVSVPDELWWEVRVLHARLYPATSRGGVTSPRLVAAFAFWWTNPGGRPGVVRRWGGVRGG
ncbi:hypothetical protein BX266_0001 [Streptomyces sp. TLI_171]|nr:hypothetical protein BX266_0001 [Streptomyces sp. TLI_171]